ncbi:uncharacterized protein BDR25DRAFT_302694 [Lindgomyces ingoldianus]|uniref:Uncharacterized protein n=1 Tax=Lindgomyces ingoldianus TaxID=673940 RepID=A0ACB6R0E2_9PLEO|nr:uncharacterized protein BDR25DRAFT_302694 [Lindgomyces ingoldianus]KAF2472560.1 hypothetical protein BDR25DRAFT_302694 [Lindgomyces ingoldianus]
MPKSSSSIESSIPPLTPHYAPDTSSAEQPESPSTTSLINSLNLQKHIEGGYFAEIDRNPLIIPNPFLLSSPPNQLWTPTPPDSDDIAPGRTTLVPRSGDDLMRNASTSIFYLLTPRSPLGAFHRNKGRTVHTLIKGRGRYVLIHADEMDVKGEVEGKKRVETFVVGHNVERGERACWVVEGGKYKGTFLMLGEKDGGEGEGLLISETVIPGFEYSDHDFLTLERFRELVTEEQAIELEWMVRKGPPPEESELL